MSDTEEYEKTFPLFPYMKDIPFMSYEQFADAVSEARNRILEVDRFLISPKGNGGGILEWEISDRIPVGRFDTDFQGIHLECFLHRKSGKRLYIMLNGANSERETRFSRWSYFSFCEGSVLCIADPMLKMYESLMLGWYYGKDELNLRRVVADFVKELAGRMGVSGEDIVFVGSSGGGAATFECASYIPGSRVVAINPQIVLEEYYYAQKFSRITGNNLRTDLYGHRNNALYYIRRHPHNPYLIIANLRSSKDMEQIGNVKELLQINLRYGLNRYDNLIIWLYDADVSPALNPHEAQEYYCIWFFIEYLLNHADGLRSQAMQDSFDCMYRLVNEFWHDHWYQKRLQKEMSHSWAELLKRVVGTDREVVLFGGGTIAGRILNEALDVQDSNFLRIRYIIDNDAARAGKEWCGCTVKHPSEMESWDRLYVLIATDRFASEIRRQLEDLGLTYKKDFIYGTDLI